MMIRGESIVQKKKKTREVEKQLEKDLQKKKYIEKKITHKLNEISENDTNDLEGKKDCIGKFKENKDGRRHVKIYM